MQQRFTIAILLTLTCSLVPLGITANSEMVDFVNSKPNYCISQIKNESFDNVLVEVTKGRLAANIQPQTTVDCKKTSLIIPFISFKKDARYRSAFIEGKALFPEEALHIKTTQGLFALWRSEIGVLAAKKRNLDDLNDDGTPVTLLKNLPQQTRDLLLLLVVDRKGMPHLQQKYNL